MHITIYALHGELFVGLLGGVLVELLGGVLVELLGGVLVELLSESIAVQIVSAFARRRPSSEQMLKTRESYSSQPKIC